MPDAEQPRDNRVTLRHGQMKLWFRDAMEAQKYVEAMQKSEKSESSTTDNVFNETSVAVLARTTAMLLEAKPGPQSEAGTLRGDRRPPHGAPFASRHR